MDKFNGADDVGYMGDEKIILGDGGNQDGVAFPGAEGQAKPVDVGVIFLLTVIF
jgi:hypothetical protein